MPQEIAIYTTSEGIRIEIEFDGDTVWATQRQIAELFQTTPQNITIHLKRIYSEKEIDKNSTCKEYLQVQNEGKRTVERKQQFYNLDAILSVGYRVNSIRGTQFRQWATQRLKDHLVKGYTLNEKRLDELRQTIQLIQKSINDETNIREAKGLLEIIGEYIQSFVLLNQYDSNNIKPEKLNADISYEISYPQAKTAIAELKKQLMARKEATALFGNEKDNSFGGTLNSVVQTFGGQYLYPSMEEQAAHLLYFVIKNHPFSDGNKRIGAFLFVWFLEKNRHRNKMSGEAKINDNALVALALLVAQSDPAEKELIIALIMQLINTQ